MTAIHYPSYPSQVVKPWLALNKQNEKYQQQQNVATTVVDQIPDPSLLTPSSQQQQQQQQQCVAQIKINHDQLYKLPPLLMKSSSPSSFLSVLLRDIPSTRQQLSTSIMSHSSSSFTCDSTQSSSISSMDSDGDNGVTTVVESQNNSNKSEQESVTASLIIKQLQLTVEKQEQEIAVLKACLAFANQKLQDVTDKAEKAIRIQQQTEHELEDLSTQLFEQANEMVAKERRLAKEQMDATMKELGSMRYQLDQERTLRQQIGHHYGNDDKENQQHYSNAIEQKNQMISIQQQQQLMMDAHGLVVFRDFVQRVRSVSSLEQIHRLFFVKQCIEQDIHPCLQRMKKLSTRKLLNSLVRRPCRIENTTLSTSSFTAAPLVICYACGIPIPQKLQEDNHDVIFQFQLNDNDKSWNRIDRPCKDRLLAISNFYEFVRHLHLGLQGQQRSIESLFHEMVWLRLYMFWARSGIIAPIHRDISAESTLLTTSKLFDARSHLFSC
ncbi:hypothetical protein BDA99DRAFT_505452 [Phascolomyces articulosus]|uniref:GDP/GTP exchange factor Sec2 N-terminal domain-containing protein n=1 Tax=Phascolomyces articulosus TaxID=60185 RepID=A0AAD5KEJ4_9FUNG|nr:hypothetical protein BDA99DRAFT_505452 [Phascolomyces articulosus]